MSDPLREGRAAFHERRWTDAFEALRAADRSDPLPADDLERLATAAYLIGNQAESAEIRARAHREHLDRGDLRRAARSAWWLAFGLLHRGERARGAGWLARAARLVEECGEPCVEEGYLRVPEALRHIGAGDVQSAYEALCRAAEIASRFSDPDLAALARHGRGRVLIRMGDLEAGVALLDEAMAAVDAGDVSPLVVGDVYCSVIEGCMEIFDLARAREWTAVLSRWCEAQPDLVPYRGQCLVYRAEIMCLGGAWLDALDEASEACERLAAPPGEPAAGAAFYQKGELHRLRGELDAAEEAYREASRWGRAPEPGLSLLRLARGDTDGAATAIRGVMESAAGRVQQCRALPAFVEIMLAAGDLDSARGGVDALDRIADELGGAYLRAAAAMCRGAVLLAGGEGAAALEPLRRAWSLWSEVDAPYEAARARTLIADACRRSGDDETAELELNAARAVFRELGAAPDVARVDARLGTGSASRAHPLTPREVEVLRLVAAGETNRTIARRLFISERTVERHVSNIFTKTGVSSRAAATAYAYEHHLVGG